MLTKLCTIPSLIMCCVHVYLQKAGTYNMCTSKQFIYPTFGPLTHWGHIQCCQ